MSLSTSVMRCCEPAPSLLHRATPSSQTVSPSRPAQPQRTENVAPMERADRAPSHERESGVEQAERRWTCGFLLRQILGTVQRWFGIQRCTGLPLPHHIADVRRFLDALFYEQLFFFVCNSLLVATHFSVFLYTLACEDPFAAKVPFVPILGTMCAASALRVLCKLRIIAALVALRRAWWQRAILGDFVQLLSSPTWQLQRLLFVVLFCVYLFALHVFYYQGAATNAAMTHAPVLMRYLSLLLLAFLSLLGPQILLFVFVCTSFTVCLFSSPEDLRQILVEEPRGASRALPSRVLQRMREEKWTAETAALARRRCLSTDELRSEDTNATGDRESSSEDKSPVGGTEEDDACTCSICLAAFNEGDLIRRLPCSHVFHSSCITRWLRSHASCPLRCYVNFFAGNVVQPGQEQMTRCGLLRLWCSTRIFKFFNSSQAEEVQGEESDTAHSSVAAEQQNAGENVAPVDSNHVGEGQQGQVTVEDGSNTEQHRSPEEDMPQQCKEARAHEDCLKREALEGMRESVGAIDATQTVPEQRTTPVFPTDKCRCAADEQADTRAALSPSLTVAVTVDCEKHKLTKEVEMNEQRGSVGAVPEKVVIQKHAAKDDSQSSEEEEDHERRCLWKDAFSPTLRLDTATTCELSLSFEPTTIASDWHEGGTTSTDCMVV